jgi:hypothetical protein
MDGRKNAWRGIAATKTEDGRKNAQNAQKGRARSIFLRLMRLFAATGSEKFLAKVTHVAGEQYTWRKRTLDCDRIEGSSRADLRAAR